MYNSCSTSLDHAWNKNYHKLANEIENWGKVQKRLAPLCYIVLYSYNLAHSPPLLWSIELQLRWNPAILFIPKFTSLQITRIDPVLQQAET
jgi:hypothetical protein